MPIKAFCVLVLCLSTLSAQARIRRETTSPRDLYILPLTFHMNYLLRAAGDYEADRLEHAERFATAKLKEDFIAMSTAQSDWQGSYISEGRLKVDADPVRRSAQARLRDDDDDQKFSVDAHLDFAVISPTKQGQASEKILRFSLELMDEDNRSLGAVDVDKRTLQFLPTEFGTKLVLQKTPRDLAKRLGQATQAKLHLLYEGGSRTLDFEGSDFSTFLSEVRPSLVGRCSRFLQKILGIL